MNQLTLRSALLSLLMLMGLLALVLVKCTEMVVNLVKVEPPQLFRVVHSLLPQAASLVITIMETWELLTAWLISCSDQKLLSGTRSTYKSFYPS